MEKNSFAIGIIRIVNDGPKIEKNSTLEKFLGLPTEKQQDLVRTYMVGNLSLADTPEEYVKVHSELVSSGVFGIESSIEDVKKLMQGITSAWGINRRTKTADSDWRIANTLKDIMKGFDGFEKIEDIKKAAEYLIRLRSLEMTVEEIIDIYNKEMIGTPEVAMTKTAELSDTDKQYFDETLKIHMQLEGDEKTAKDKAITDTCMHAGKHPTTPEAEAMARELVEYYAEKIAKERINKIANDGIYPQIEVNKSFKGIDVFGDDEEKIATFKSQEDFDIWCERLGYERIKGEPNDMIQIFKKKKEGMTKTAAIENMHCVSRTFTGLLTAIAQYTLTNILKSSEPQFLTNSGYKYAEFVDIQTDVGETKPVVNNVLAIYPDKVVNAAMQYGDYIVSCFAPSRKEAQQWMDDLQTKMIKENQYRGKCLYVENRDVRFHSVPKVAWDDVILDDNIKKDIRMNTVAFLGDDLMAKVGVNKRGLIMYGPPGTGKTSIVKAIFNELHGKPVSRLYVTAESFARMSAGSLFDLLPYLGKTAMAFEDIDMIGTSRDVSYGSNLLGDLLTNLDGMRAYDDPIVIMASTNKISMLDEALANRPCRFDRKIEVGLPSKANLKTIYKKFSGLDVGDDVIDLSEGFTGSHVVETVNTAKILASYNNKNIADCLIDACNIIRSNFFPGQRTIEIKASAMISLKKLGVKIIKKSKRNKTVYEVGDKIKFKDDFSYENTAGGTGSANDNPITDLDTNFSGIASGTVIKILDDYEIGITYHVKLDQEYWNMIKDKAKNNIAYVSEFNVVEDKTLESKTAEEIVDDTKIEEEKQPTIPTMNYADFAWDVISDLPQTRLPMFTDRYKANQIKKYYNAKGKNLTNEDAIKIVKEINKMVKTAAEEEKKYDEEQLAMGKEIEKEHAPTVAKIKASIQDGNITMTDEEIFASIAMDHLDELPHVYYTLLNELEIKGKQQEADLMD